MQKLNRDVAYQDQQDFKALLAVDSKRMVDAVRLIGKV